MRLVSPAFLITFAILVLLAGADGLQAQSVNNRTAVNLTLLPHSVPSMLPNQWTTVGVVAKAAHPVLATGNAYHNALPINGPSWGKWEYAVKYSSTGEAGSYRAAEKGSYSLKITLGASTLAARDGPGFDKTTATYSFAFGKAGYWQIEVGKSVAYDDQQTGQHPGAFDTWKGDGTCFVMAQVGVQPSQPTNEVVGQSTTVAMHGGDEAELVISCMEYMPAAEKERAGDLSHDNPDGDGKECPAFKGGWRFFPDAADYETRDKSRNLVRIRAVMNKPNDGVEVHFRSFDVADPSTNKIINPHGNAGLDNRGTVEGVNVDSPGPLSKNGYRGRLRPINGKFGQEGASVTVKTSVHDSKSIADVELATSFNPGDNFRVLASLQKDKLQALQDQSEVPTRGEVKGFKGAATEQLSVWRRFHIEHDTMARIPFGQRAAGQITNVLGIPLFGVQTQAKVILSFKIGKEKEFLGGTLRDSAGNRYDIVDHDTKDKSTVHVILPLGQGGLPLTNIPALGSVILTQGNFQMGKGTGQGAPQNGTVDVTTDIQIVGTDEYSGGILRSGGINYSIVNNTRGVNSHVTIKSQKQIALGNIEVFQNDYQAAGNAVPAVRINPPDDADFFYFLDGAKKSTLRAQNRYADAYMQPEYHALKAFNSTDVVPAGHFPTFIGDNPFDAYRGTGPGKPPRPKNYETPVFWAVYVLAAYEPQSTHDNKPPEKGAVLGLTDSEDRQVSLVFVETIRNVTSTNPALSVREARARTVAHEIGHQFALAHGNPPDVDNNNHRAKPLNIMSPNTSKVPDHDFYFDPHDIVFLRERINSPGK